MADFPEKHPISGALIEACVEAGIPYREDLNNGDQEGVTWFQMTARKGKRHSAANAYLHPAMDRANLLVEKRAMTTRILFEGKKAVGVEFLQNGEKRRVMVAREVILSAGSVESPKLLEISGVGRGELLRELGVTVVHETPMVGENMQDHVMIGCQARLKENWHSINYRATGVNLVKELAKYGVAKTGILSMAVAHGCAFTKTRPELEHPDMQIHMMAASMDLEVLATTQGLQLEKEPGMASNPCQLRPESRGSVHARSPDGTEPPRIVPNYLSTNKDVADVIASARMSAKRLYSSTLMSAWTW